MSYKPTLSGNWWLQHRFFRAYMLREATVLPLVFLICSLLAGVYSFASLEQFNAWQEFMAKPWVIGIHALALLASLYHALTFFQLFPRVMPIRLGDKQVPAILMVAGQWAGTVAVMAIFLWLFGGES